MRLMKMNESHVEEGVEPEQVFAACMHGRPHPPTRGRYTLVRFNKPAASAPASCRLLLVYCSGSAAACQ